MDWNKYSDSVICTGGSDQLVKLWDIRFPQCELAILQGHEYGVRRVQFSPHHENTVASVGYDMTMRIWNTAGKSPMIRTCDAHTEFVVGFDWSLHEEGLWATCAWDEEIHVGR